jgi:S-adenosylmethionine-dependent methyltransferase
MTDAGHEVFDEHLDAWRAWQRTPWGRIRYHVVAETLSRTCAVLRPGPLRVLDVGGGDGADSLTLARSGHSVTVVDISAPLLRLADEAAAASGLTDRVTTVRSGLDGLEDLGLGGFDLVLCHNVVQYVADLDATVAALARSVGSGGALSLLAPNPAADVMSAAAAREDPAAALALLDAPTQHTETFAHDVRRIPVEAATESLDAAGLTDRTTYGIQCVTHLVPNRRKEEPAFFAELEALELALCDREPYLRVARFWQLVARRS